MLVVTAFVWLKQFRIENNYPSINNKSVNASNKKNIWMSGFWFHLIRIDILNKIMYRQDKVDPPVCNVKWPDNRKDFDRSPKQPNPNKKLQPI